MTDRRITLKVTVRIPWWKRAALDASIWIINRVARSIRNNVKVA